MATMKNITIMGAGNGGLAMAADLTFAGFKINIVESKLYKSNIESLSSTRRIKLKLSEEIKDDTKLLASGKEGETEISGKITTDFSKVEKSTDLLIVVSAAQGHELFFSEIPTKFDKPIVIIAGHYGALSLRNFLKKKGIYNNNLIMETDTLPYATRKTTKNEVLIFGVKRKFMIGALPSSRGSEALEILRILYPQIELAKNVIQTSLSSGNPIMHPISVLSNLYMTEKKFYPYDEDFGQPIYHYYNITPGTARIMEQIDRERIEIGKALGLKILSQKERVKELYGAEGPDLYHAMINTKVYMVGTAPTSLSTRYLTEDVPYGLVPAINLAKKVNVETPITNAVAELACAATGTNFFKTGYNLAKLGIENINGKNVREVL